MTTVTTLMNMKKKGDKITMLTCYDYSMAKLMDNAGVDTLLVGDSLGPYLGMRTHFQLQWKI